MVIDIKNDKYIPAGRYVLWNQDKIDRAKKSLSPSASEREVLIEYDKIGGLIVKDNEKLPPQTLWNMEKTKIADSMESLSDAELLAVLRKAENTHIPGSQYQRANTEWQIRQQNKLIEATKTGKGGIFFEVGGNMKNDGVIQAGENAIIDVAVAGNYSSQKGKVVQVQGKTQDFLDKYKYYIIMIILGLIAILFFRGKFIMEIPVGIGKIIFPNEEKLTQQISSFILYHGGENSKIEILNRGTQDIYLHGDQFNNEEKSIMYEKRIIPAGYSYFLNADSLSQWIKVNIGINGEKYVPFDIFLTNVNQEKYVIKNILYIKVANSLINIQPQTISIEKNSW